MYQIARYVDLDTGETVEGTIAQTGDMIIRSASLQQKKIEIPFVKLHRYPSGLTKTENKIMAFALDHNHLRGRDNAILTGNERPIKTAADLGRLAGINSARQAQEAVRGLVDKRFLGIYDGVYHLNYQIATIGRGTIDKQIYKLFN